MKNKRTPLLSVIVPVYNVEKYLRRCLDSIIGQSYENIEIICIDDGSTDKSGEILEEYASIDNRIIVIHQNNQGLVSVRKRAASIARGRYIASVDSDDWIEKDMFEGLMKWTGDTGADLIVSSEIRDYGDHCIKASNQFISGLYRGKDLQQLKTRIIDTDNPFRFRFSPHICDKIIKKEIYKKHQDSVPVYISIGEDAAVTFPIIMDAERIVITGDWYYHYCIRPDSIMGSGEKGNQEVIDYWRIFFPNKMKYSGRSVSNIVNQTDLISLYFCLFINIEGTIKYDGKTLFPYGSVDPNERVLIYGAGKYGRLLYNLIKKKRWFRNLIWADEKGNNDARAVDLVNFEELDVILVGALQGDAVDSILNELNKRNTFGARVYRVNPNRENTFE